MSGFYGPQVPHGFPVPHVDEAAQAPPQASHPPHPPHAPPLQFHAGQASQPQFQQLQQPLSFHPNHLQTFQDAHHAGQASLHQPHHSESKSLDEIVQQNANELNERRFLTQQRPEEDLVPTSGYSAGVSGPYAFDPGGGNGASFAGLDTSYMDFSPLDVDLYNEYVGQQQQQQPLPAMQGVGYLGSISTPIMNVPAMSTFVPPGGPTWQPPEGGWPSSMTGRLHSQTVFKNAYSQSGFDMLSILMRVATRPNPEIQIGAVDMSCAFVVSDAEQEDLPIVYCSESFERLTGYTKDMLLGINCRFLQSPDGRVQAGEQRRYVDGRTVYYLKKKLLEFRETQVSLINYRRGGQPFMNLLTMIPISWDSDDVKYFVGFQVDLVEQPGAVTEQNPDGTYNINYQRSAFMPPYIKAAPHMPANPGPAVTPVQVSAMLAGTVVPRQLWHRVVLENVDDVVQVLSPKGIFQRLFPAAERVLEYMPGELIGTALSAVCHPSDIVSVTRELREMNNGSSIHVLFRIRRKHNGYMWFDCHGMLKAELQVKDRRFIVLFGRERPVYRLRRAEITASGGIGDNELWTKLSTSGILLFVSSHVKQLLDRQPEELIGTRIQNIMRPESENLFGNKLKQARHGQRTSVKHEMINRRGQVLSAHTVLYPGDGTTKPAFLIAQTRFHKFNRNTATNRDRMSTSDAGSHSLSTHSSIRSSLDGGQQTPKSIFNTNNNKSTQTFVQSTEEDENGNLFEELSVTKPSAWQYEIRQLEKRNRAMAEEVQMLIAAKKRRKRRKNSSNITKDCAHCHTKVTPEWRRGPSGQRDLCNSCGLRWAKSNGRISPRNAKTSATTSSSNSPAWSAGKNTTAEGSTGKIPETIKEE